MEGLPLINDDIENITVLGYAITLADFTQMTRA
ncbi:MAG: hypothetical protein ACI80S_001342 [Pseudohongiellaceae bacterium]|jgi:hypothetical protein